MFISKGTSYSHLVSIAPNLNVFLVHESETESGAKKTLSTVFVPPSVTGMAPYSGLNYVLTRNNHSVRINAEGSLVVGGKELTGVFKQETVDRIGELITAQFKANHFIDRVYNKLVVIVVGKSTAFV